MGEEKRRREEEEEEEKEEDKRRRRNQVMECIEFCMELVTICMDTYLEV